MFGADDAFMAFLFLASASYPVTFVVDQVQQNRHMKEYETSFVELHKEIISKHQDPDDQPQNVEQPAETDDGKVPTWVSAKGVIKLQLEHRNRENLLEICKSYYGPWTVNRYVDNVIHKLIMKYDPREETQFITFKTIDPPLKPVPVEVIRCNTQYAIIAVGDGSKDGYLLKTVKKIDIKVPGMVFNIRGKMTIKEKKPKGGDEKKEGDKPKEGDKSSSSDEETVELKESEEVDVQGQTSPTHSPTHREQEGKEENKEEEIKETAAKDEKK